MMQPAAAYHASDMSNLARSFEALENQLGEYYWIFSKGVLQEGEGRYALGVYLKENETFDDGQGPVATAENDDPMLCVETVLEKIERL